MDDYELQQALEAMAGAAAVPVDADNNAEAIETTTARWQKLFNLTDDEAMDQIVQHRNDLARARVSDEHWSAFQAEMTASGYDREAYEYELNLEKHSATIKRALPEEIDAAGTVSYLVELKDRLSDVETVRKVAGLTEAPKIVTGRSAETYDDVQLCRIDARARAKILRWAADEGRGYEPTILVNPESM